MNKVIVIIAGSLMILIGLFSILHMFNVLTLDLAKLWPIFFLVIGIMLVIDYFSKGFPLQLIFGSTMVLYGTFLLIFTLASNQWEAMTKWWPLFPLGLGLSFLIALLLGGGFQANPKLYYISAIILTSFGLWFLLANILWADLGKAWPIMLAIDGGLIIANEFLGFLGSASGSDAGSE